MRRPRLLLGLSLFLVSALPGCGGRRSVPASSSIPQTLSLSGNWEILPRSVVTETASVEIVGSLVSDGSQVTGVLHVIASQCYELDQTVPVSGTLNSSTNTLSVTSG